MKAYRVSSGDDSDWSTGMIIAFAGSASRARLIASKYIEYDQFVDLRAIRCPDADIYAPATEGILHGNRIYRLLGWHQETCAQCEECELYQFDNVEESYVDEEGDGLCVECRRKTQSAEVSTQWDVIN